MVYSPAVYTVPDAPGARRWGSDLMRCIMADQSKKSVANAKARYGDGVSSRSSTVQDIRKRTGRAELAKGAAPAKPA